MVPSLGTSQGQILCHHLRMEQTKNKPLSSHWLQGKTVH